MEFCENELLIFYWIYDFGIIVKIFILKYFILLTFIIQRHHEYEKFYPKIFKIIDKNEREPIKSVLFFYYIKQSHSFTLLLSKLYNFSQTKMKHLQPIFPI